VTYFPQLSTGALSQYPIKKRISHRTIVNQLEDGTRVALVDANAASIRWEMSYEGLSDEEGDALLAFFATVEGRLGSFTFFDPVSNLVGWSETLSAAAWQRNGLLTITSSVSDPLGTTRASTVVNTGAGTLTFGQELSIPGATTCCWSFYARSGAAEAISLTRTSGSMSASVVGTAGPDWRRFELSSSLPSGDTTSIFELSLNAGVELDLFGFQVDAQPAASQYVQTSAAGGVYTAARFDMDEITITGTGPNQSSCTLQLITRVNG
jgi:hypothetical protein